MASLSHASFATPNTQQLSPSHKLLPAHLSMDPASSSLSTLSQPYSSPELTTWLHKPNAKLSYSQPQTMSSFNHHYGISSPLYEGYSEAGGSVEQGFIGGDDPLLTSSWEALDKLVSASMIGSGSADGAELSEFAYSSAQGSSLRSTSPSAVEQKPILSGLFGIDNQKGGVLNMWADSQASASNANIAHTTTSNVGLNLASLITADPGFVERAAKFSSYSQQAHITSFNQCANNITSTNNAMVLENSYLPCAKKLASMSATKALSTNGPMVHKGDNVAVDYDANSNIKVSTISTSTTIETNQVDSPQRSTPSLSGSKKKREGSNKDGEVDDAGDTVGRKRAKGEEDIVSSAKNNNKAGRVSGGDHKSKMQQCAAWNSAESEQKSGGGGKETISKPVGSNITTNTNTSSASQAPKPDFIHVRARRGQATDSHSLAERVRREKISERMKYLQDLVPGCTKVTGKAMMLDEIINYVQSLQRQVEFLSMKLAAVHPSKLEFNFESLFGKEVVQQAIVQNNQTVSYAPETHPLFKSYPLLYETAQPLPLQPHHEAFPESNPSSSMHSYGSDAALRGTLSMLAPASSDNFGDHSISSQMTNSWDEDLQNLVQLGFPQTSLNANSSLHGILLHDQMKPEL